MWLGNNFSCSKNQGECKRRDIHKIPLSDILKVLIYRFKEKSFWNCKSANAKHEPCWNIRYELWQSKMTFSFEQRYNDISRTYNSYLLVPATSPRSTANRNFFSSKFNAWISWWGRITFSSSIMPWILCLCMQHDSIKNETKWIRILLKNKIWRLGGGVKIARNEGGEIECLFGNVGNQIHEICIDMWKSQRLRANRAHVHAFTSTHAHTY